MDCRDFDEQVVRLERIKDIADQFVRVRLSKVEGVDLNVFQFDYDLTMMVFFLNAEERIYGRYGGRGGESADARLSLAGLHYAMKAALDAHRRKVVPLDHAILDRRPFDLFLGVAPAHPPTVVPTRNRQPRCGAHRLHAGGRT